MDGAPGRTRTSTMLPLPDFESGASTNSATGAGGRDHSREARGVNGPHLPSVPRPSERPSSAMRHKFTREREPGPRAPGLSRALLPRRSLIRSCGPWVPGLVEFTLGPRRADPGARPGHERTSHLHEPRGAIYLGTRPITAFARAE